MGRPWRLPRRDFLALGGAAARRAAAAGPGLRRHATGAKLHGLSVFGDLKYPAGLHAFRLRQPGGAEGRAYQLLAAELALQPELRTFNTLNSFVLKGDAPPRMEMTFDTLMTRALDEPDALYGLVAETRRRLGRPQQLHFRLRPEARFHDGSPLTAEDVAFSFELSRRRATRPSRAADRT